MIIRSFRLRLAVVYTVVVVLIFSVFVFVADLQFRKNLLEKADKDLLRTAVSGRFRQFDAKSLTEGKGVGRAFEDESYEFINREGSSIVSDRPPEQKWPLNKKLVAAVFNGTHQFETVISKGVKYRLLYFPFNEDFLLRVGVPLEDMQEAIASLESILILSFPLMVALLAFVGWFLAGKSVDPLLRIKSLSQEIRWGRLDKRIDMGRKGKEIDDLVVMFNEMLDSIQHSVESRKRFTSDVSHEIRSPLTSLRGSIEVMLRKRRTPEEYEDLLKNNLSDIIRLSKIAESLLFLSSADNDTVELRKKKVDMNEILGNVIESVSYEGLSLDEQLGNGVEIEGDSDLLERAFSNLIGNAIKYTPCGGTVTVVSEREQDCVKVTIRDTGVGIPADEIPHIFGRFYRVDKERARNSGGTGLGLAIAHWIINAHKGRIMIKSEVGKGSDFQVIFPSATDGQEEGRGDIS